MRYFKLFEDYYHIHQQLKELDIENYTINKNGLVDVDGDVNLNMQYKKINFKFGNVYGKFNCAASKLNSLYFCPSYVRGHFNCSRNNLTSLEGCPIEIGDEFYCDNNKLTTLIGGPKTVGGFYSCARNKISDFHGFPENFKETLFMEDNPAYELTWLIYPFTARYLNKFIKFLNEYDVIRKGNVIIEQRLEEAYYMTLKIELSEDNKKKIKNYKLV